MCYYINCYVTLTWPVSISLFRSQTQFSFSLDLNTLRVRLKQFKNKQTGTRSILKTKKLDSQLTTKTGHTSSTCEVC